jgi:hypothetical protein
MTETDAARDGLTPAARRALAAFVAHLRDERGLSPHRVAACRRDATPVPRVRRQGGVTDPAAVEPLLLRRFLALQRTRGLAAPRSRARARRCAPCSGSCRGAGWWPRTRRPRSGSRGPRKLPVVLKPGRRVAANGDATTEP